MNDPIVDEVRRVRDAHAARFNYDLDAIFRDLKKREKESGFKFVDGVARQTARQPAEDAGSVSRRAKSVDRAPAAKR